MDDLKDQLDRLPGGLLITDTKSKAVYANLAVEKRTGFAIGEIVGKSPGQLWGGKMARGFYNDMWQTIGKEKRPFIGAVKNVKKNGTLYTDSLFIAPIKDQGGHTRYFAEIHPEFREKKEEEAFHKEFTERAGSLHRERNPFSWIFQNLQRKERGADTIGALPRKNFPDLVSLFYELLVLPMEKLFSRRHEDAGLIREAQDDPRKFSRLYEKYYLLIRQYFLRRLNSDAETAEDLTQETFARAFSYLPRFRLTNASYYTYLLRISHNLLVNYYRKHSDRALSSQDAEFIEAPAFLQETAGFDRLLLGLSEKEKAIMLMKYQDGLKVKEIAQETAKSENAVKLILSRTRRKLKERLVM